MTKISYLEKFLALQGEGARVGVPSVFLRLTKCNFQCKGFGNPDMEDIDYHSIDLTNITDLDKTPIFPKGCDSAQAWHAHFKPLWKEDTPENLAKELLALTPNSSFDGIDLIFTGGEPLLLKAQKDVIRLLNHLPDVRNITWETNGSQELGCDLKNYLIVKDIKVLWSVSTKLSHSGEPEKKRIVPSALFSYNKILRSKLVLKFVIAGEQDILEVRNIVKTYEDYGVKIYAVYLMPVGGTYEEYQKNARPIAELALKYGMRYSPRLHVDLFRNSWGT